MITLALIGCGHIGGSFALGLRSRGLVDKVVGFDLDAGAAQQALDLGICTEIAPSMEDAARVADIVAIAVPVRSIAACARRLAACIPPRCVVTDVGSTKAGIVNAAEAALGGDRFIGSHPLAGTERSGPAAADPGLFAGRRVFLTPTPNTSMRTKAYVADLWRGVGAVVLELDAETHDRVMAAVSHLPHAIAYTLAGTIGQGPQGGAEFAGLSGGGFLDTTRIAATLPAMWVDVFIENKAAVLDLIDGFQVRLSFLRHAIQDGDESAIGALLESARLSRKRILGE